MSTRNGDDSDDDDDDVSTIDIGSDNRADSDDDTEDEGKIKLKEPKIWPTINSTWTIALGGAQVGIGACEVVCGVAGLGRNALRTDSGGNSVDNDTFYLAAGIWAGTAAIIGGGLLIGSGIKKSTWVIMSSILFCIISGLAGLASLIIAVLGIAQEYEITMETASLVICAVLVVLSSAQLGTAVYGAVLCFQTLCGNDEDSHKPDVYENYRGTSSMGSGAIMIICGVTCIIVNMAGVMYYAWAPYDPTNYDRLMYSVEDEIINTCFAAWGSTVHVAGGALAIRAKTDNTTWIIASSMTLCIISTIFSAGIIAGAIIMLADNYNNTTAGVVMGSLILVAGAVGFIASAVTASFGGILCGVCRVNKVKPKPKTPEPPPAVEDNNQRGEGPVHAQMMYMNVQGLPEAISDAQAPPAAHIQPVPGVSTGQMLYLREEGGDGQINSMRPYIIQQPMILGYQQAIIQQTLIPMQQINQDDMFSAEQAPPIVPIPGLQSHNTENDRGHQAPPRAQQNRPPIAQNRPQNRPPNGPSNGPPNGPPNGPHQLPTLNPPPPPRSGPQGKSSYKMSVINEGGSGV